MTEIRKKFEGKHSDLTGKIPGAFFDLYKETGYGFSEKVYETALAILLEELGLVVEHQKSIKVYFHGRLVGEYIADMVINGLVLLELKQWKNYPKSMRRNCSTSLRPPKSK